MLKDFKGKAAIHVEWVKAWGQCLAELQVHGGGGDDGHTGGDDGHGGDEDRFKLMHLQAYVKQFHTTGLVWAKSGGDAIMVARQPNKGEVRVMMKKATNHTNPQKFRHHHKVPKQDGGDGVNDGDNEEDNHINPNKFRHHPKVP